MAAQLYSNTKLAECLFEVLEECVNEGMISENLAQQTLHQFDQVRLVAGDMASGLAALAA